MLQGMGDMRNTPHRSRIYYALSLVFMFLLVFGVRLLNHDANANSMIGRHDIPWAILVVYGS
jgi:hypothetical protein